MRSLFFLLLVVGASANLFRPLNNATISSHSGPVGINDVPCPGGTACPDGNTCCQLASGQYGCCPIVDAVCCSDHLHCCPNGYTCDVEHSRCKKKFDRVKDVPCPGGTACPDGNTCCQLASGEYGCCPIVDAVCCSDHLHCCPNGYTCDVEHSKCNKKFDRVKDVPCPGGTACPDGNTCCQLASGEYGCCPIVDAVCCSDHLHCCPNGYTCDVEHSKCNKKFDRVKDVPCPGGTACPDGNTCCQLASGDYGCCPLTDAVCCNDHLHCCPHGYTCDVEKGQCLQGISIPWLTKKPSFRRHQQLVDIVDAKETNNHDDSIPFHQLTKAH